MSSPNDRKYAKTHEWVKIEDGIAIIGISDHAQDSLGDITFVEVPSVGKQLSQGAELGVVESVKAASDIYAPVSGEVTEVNQELEATPELLNSNPYDTGWLIKLKNVQEADLETLMDADAYETFLENE